MREDPGVAADDIERAVRRALAALRKGTDIVEAVEAENLTAEDWLRVRARLGKSLASLHRATDGINKRLEMPGARERILRYLRLRLGEIVDKDELAGVAGIHEWARRVRELRVEHGWPISSAMTRDDLKMGQYVLEAEAPNEQLAADWRIAKSIRNLRAGGRGASGKTRMLEYLKAIFPRSADKEQLAYVAHGTQDRPRRLRELAEEGWRVISSLDDPALAPGSYRLDGLDQLPQRAREPIKLRHRVFERDNFQCKDCGRTPRKEKVQLQAHHLVPVTEGGKNDPDNLVTLCSDCHAGRHSIAHGKARDELLNPSAEGAY